MPFFRLDRFDRSGFDYGRSKFYVLIWFLCQETLFRFSPVPCHDFRRKLVKIFGCRVGKQVILHPRARLHYPWRIEIGDHSWIGDEVRLYSIAPIKIGEHTIISQKCFLCTAGHDYDDPHFKTTQAPITVGNGVWLAADVYVAPGVTIGDNTVIGARSSVFHDMPAKMVCYGYPCRPIRPRGAKPE
ncbi:MAG: WcaF family extracellular polysaccharide biosynthesis acetyltransferase [Deltaproteobacteria bacterium]